MTAVPDSAVEAYRRVPKPGCPVCGRTVACRCYVTAEQREAARDAYDRARLAAAYPWFAALSLQHAATRLAVVLEHQDCADVAALELGRIAGELLDAGPPFALSEEFQVPP